MVTSPKIENKRQLFSVSTTIHRQNIVVTMSTQIGIMVCMQQSNESLFSKID